MSSYLSIGSSHKIQFSWWTSIALVFQSALWSHFSHFSSGYSKEEKKTKPKNLLQRSIITTVQAHSIKVLCKLCVCTIIQIIINNRSMLNHIENHPGNRQTRESGKEISLFYKNKCLLWYQNRRQSFIFLIFGNLVVPPTPQCDRSPTQSAYQFDKLTVMPRGKVDLCYILYLHVRLRADEHILMKRVSTNLSLKL